MTAMRQVICSSANSVNIMSSGRMRMCARHLRSKAKVKNMEIVLLHTLFLLVREPNSNVLKCIKY